MSVTSEDIKKIVSEFLLHAPPGEFHEVVTDVRNLLGNDALLNEIASESFREYNSQQMLIVDAPDRSHKVLVTKFGEISPNEYLDPAGGQVFTFDHFKQEVSGSRDIPGELNSDAEPFRSAVQAKVDEYIRNFYDRGAAAVYSSAGPTIQVCISSAIFNASNFYNGRWRSSYTVKISGGKATVEGNIRVHVHFYEGGNVQLNTNITKKKEGLPAKEPPALAEALVKAIAEIEAEYQNNLEISYDKMNKTTFKALRRALPVFATKIKWEKITQYSLGSDIQQKK
jgi:capping protein alpha